MPHWPKKKAGSHSTRWRTTSRATQPSHGDGFSQAPGGTASTRSVNWPATRWYRSEISLIAVVPLVRRPQPLGPSPDTTVALAGTHRSVVITSGSVGFPVSRSGEPWRRCHQPATIVAPIAA